MKRILIGSIFLLTFSAVYITAETGSGYPGNFKAARLKMVKDQISARGINNKRVLKVMRKVKRHLFVPVEMQRFAYTDRPLPIGYDQTISQPYIVAFMTEVVNPKKTDKVLEIGTGSGYQAAVLAGLCKEVYTIEIVEPLAEKSADLLKKLGYENVVIRAGDGFKGWEEKAPFDCIIVTAAPQEIPAPLLEQLAEGGRMVIPVGPQWRWQKLFLIKKINGKIIKSDLLTVRFVPMTGPGAEKINIKNEK